MDKRKIIIIALSWLLVLISMVMIFYFSKEDGQKSTSTSDKIVDAVIETLPNKDHITSQQRTQISFSVRKLAHFGIYMLLGFTLINAVVNSSAIKTYFRVLISLGVSVLYAIYDEFLIQANTSGRAPQWTDVAIDTSGAIIGIFLFIFTIFVYSRIQVKLNQKKGIS